MSLPADFLRQIQSQLGDDFGAFEAALNTSPPTSIRINTQKVVPPKLPIVDWCSLGHYLPQRPLFTLDPIWHAGGYYPQEASSMFIGQAVQQVIPQQPLRVLDLCAAPGGKTTLLSSILPKGSLLVANEVIKPRALILAENVQKWGDGNTVVTNNDPAKFQALSNFFDVLVIDAPCSGEGLFRKDPKAISEWSLNNVKLCAERQKRIVMDAWNCLKPGGILIYSTCTYNVQENEENLQWIASQTNAITLPLDIDVSWGVQESQYNMIHGYRFFPHKAKGEGFFMAVLQKPGELHNNKPTKIKRPSFQKPDKKTVAAISNWWVDNGHYTYVQYQEVLVAFLSHHLNDVEELHQKLHVLYSGTAIAEVKKKNLVPLPTLAFSSRVNLKAFNCIEVDHETAIRFLRKENINPDSNDGIALITYKNTPLGWLKKMGNRSNNYYPKSWRIRMEYKSTTLLYPF